MKGRTLFDLSSLARWHGPSVGIPRVQQKYALFALENVKNVQFTLFDLKSKIYRSITREYAEAIIRGTLSCDMSMEPDPNRFKAHFVDKVPKFLRPTYWWLTKPRRKILHGLERYRLRTNSPWKARMIEGVQAKLITSKHRAKFYNSDGTRKHAPAFSDLAGDAIQLTADDVTIALQNDWLHTDITAISAMKRQAGSRHVILCHDIIPILHPDWFTQEDVDCFKTYWNQAFPIADHVIFTSRQAARDAADYARGLGFELEKVSVVPLGSDIEKNKKPSAERPAGLSIDKFALFVSTIEPRKNHRMLVQAWRQLVSEGIPNRTEYKLVFVGRPGWKMGSFLEEISRDPSLKDSLMHLGNVDDAALLRLYMDAGFCVYPPLYEGFGLPIVEALSLHKALLVSNAGPMPEIAGDFAVAIDPHDTDAWAKAMAEWIMNPEIAKEYAARAARDYEPMNWEDSARQFFDRALD